MEAARFGLDDQLIASIVKMARDYELDKLLLFGSRARGDNRPRSDIDLAVSGGRTTDFALDIDEALPTLLMFDVVNLDCPMQCELREEIARDGVILYEKS